jgi:lipoate-protein ligase B
MSSCLLVELGLIGFAEAFALQKRIVAARKAEAIGDVLLLCEHPHVITLGRNGSREHLLASEPVLRQKGVEFHATNRGGDITYHGPGQIVGYPVVNLSAIRRDVVWYVRMLEEVMIQTCADFGVGAGRELGKTGVWVGPAETSKNLTQRAQRRQSGDAEKIGAIGVHISRWVTSHGFAFNVATDLRFFDLIVPCGIAGRAATSLEKVLGRRVEVKEVAPNLTRHFGEVFGLEMKATSREKLFEVLQGFDQPLAIPA